MHKLLHKFCLLALIFIFFYTAMPCYAVPAEAELSEGSSILMDTLRGQVLYEKDSSKSISPSIMCKLMTAFVTIDKVQINGKVTISKNAASAKGSSLDLTVGNQYSVEDLLFGEMLSSSNDSAIALAEYVGNGDVSKFVSYMNDEAKKQMLTDTHFVNPTGLYDEKQFTSVRDIAKLIKAAIANPVYNYIFGSKGIPWINGKESSILTNQNKMFWSYAGVDGGKIGTNPNQGSIAVTTATRDGRRLVAVVYAKDEKSALAETANLFNYGFSNYQNGILVSKDTSVRTITVDNVNVNLISKIDVYYTYPVGESFIKSINFTKNEKLTLPIKTDTIAGVLKYTLNDGTEINVDLYSDKEIVAPEDYKSKIKTIFDENRDLVVIVVILIIIEFAIVISYMIRFIVKMTKKMGQSRK